MSADVDLLVIGAGGCGLAAAIAGHDAGLSTAVVEKLDRPGGNSSLSTGSVPAANSRFQREAGINDDPETYARDLMGIAKETDDFALVKRLTEVSAETVEWLVDTVGARMQLITAYKHIGHSVPRLHAPVSRRGQDLVDDLIAAAGRRDIPIAVGNAVKGLIVEDGAVRGAVIDSSDGLSRIVARKTVLAVNGFAGDPDLVRRFCPEIAGAQYFGARGSTGEAIRWGEALGAGLANMAAYQGYAAVAHPHGSLLSWTTIEKGGFLVGADGRRFGDESLGYSGYARIVLGQGEYSFAIFDQKIFDIAAQEEEFAELARYGGVKKADSVAELAEPYGLDPAALTEELERYNAAASGEQKDRFGRKDFGLGPLVAPFYGCRTVPGLFHTQGGLRIDGDARVLTTKGVPVPNLFAGGGAAAGISGRSGALGYASGNGLLSAIALGRLAALAAAREIRSEA
ncbi:fumarate reductase [Afipia sp. P52-10]|jgi:fumarate reductase flavoprotein subunit|uniref:FAD-dependent oxidoreductase n=1 Tax=Afipia sp. P52-10 TaxID=1429916 RepID=UPI0003DF3380|nr:FAD-binding protein [Afipia sp. P52-10]ETR78729.1 fumarate reductase [Afipia sp. P52-10]